jgi:hypothetical protein
MAEPEYRLTVEDRPGYLFARMSGEEDSLESTMAAVTELAGICMSRGVTKVLVEHDMPGRLSTLDVFKMATKLPDLFEGIHVGFVIHRTEIPDNPQFLENVARNRGALGRLFGSVAEAEAWLLSL